MPNHLSEVNCDVSVPLLHRESVESLIQKHSYARSPIRTYGEEDVLGEESQTTPNRGKAIYQVQMWRC